MRDVLSEASEVLGPLLYSLNYAPPVLESGAGFANAVFVGENNAVIVEYDQRDETMDVAVAMIVDRSPAKRGATINGKKGYDYLVNRLVDAGLPVAEAIDRTMHKDPIERSLLHAKRTLELNSQWIKGFGSSGK